MQGKGGLVGQLAGWLFFRLIGWIVIVGWPFWLVGWSLHWVVSLVGELVGRSVGGRPSGGA